MKANEFVKRFGCGEAKKFIGWYGGDTAFKFIKVKEKTISVHSGDQPYDFHINELKSLFESLELVEKLGGLESAKDEYFSCVQNNEPASYLAKAIADVESCQ